MTYSMADVIAMRTSCRARCRGPNHFEKTGYMRQQLAALEGGPGHVATKYRFRARKVICSLSPFYTVLLADS